MRTIWTPQPKQLTMMRRREYEAFYGGAAGGGKSDYLLVEALRQVKLQNYRGIIFRKTYPELSELIDRSAYLYKSCYPDARYNDSKHVWTFGSGAKIYFGNLQHARDKIHYQGKRYDFVGMDELTHFTWEEYSYMYSRNRPSGPGTRVYRRATGNPGGIGHGWVKNYFVTAAEPFTPITSEMRLPDGSGKLKTYRRNRIFIPSKVWDNPALLNADPNYIGNIGMMDQAERDALLDGNWDSFNGQVFMEWRDDPEHYGKNDRKWTHVIDPFDIPEDWKVYRGLDWGFAKPFAVEWIAQDHEDRMYIINELYGCTRQANTGVKLTPAAVARKIKEIESTDPNLKGRKIRGIADPAIWQEDGGETIAGMMEREKVYFERGDHTRIPGKMQFHYRLFFDEIGQPMVYVFKDCRHFIRTIPNLVYDEKDVEDIDTEGEDHIYDCVRYVFQAHPLNPRKNATYIPWNVLPKDDPLEQKEKAIWIK